MTNSIDLRGRQLPSLELRPGSDATFGLTIKNKDLAGFAVHARIGVYTLDVGAPDPQTRRMVVSVKRAITSVLAPVESLSIWLVDADDIVTAIAYGSVLTDQGRPV